MDELMNNIKHYIRLQERREEKARELQRADDQLTALEIEMREQAAGLNDSDKEYRILRDLLARGQKAAP